MNPMDVSRNAKIELEVGRCLFRNRDPMTVAWPEIAWNSEARAIPGALVHLELSRVPWEGVPAPEPYHAAFTPEAAEYLAAALLRAAGDAAKGVVDVHR
jgi:hypothetical protein